MIDAPVVCALTCTLSIGAALQASAVDYGIPQHVEDGINTASTESGPSISSDGLSLYFQSSRRNEFSGNDNDLYVITRPTKDSPWSTPTNLGSAINQAEGQDGASISADGLSLYFSTHTAANGGAGAIYVSTRADTNSPWGTAVALDPVINAETASDPKIAADGLSLYFNSARFGGLGGFDIWVSQRATVNSPWATPTNLGPAVNSTSSDVAPTISGDGLTLMFSSTRPGGAGGRTLWASTRNSTSDPWPPAEVVLELISSWTDWQPDISIDGKSVYWASNRAGGEGSYDLWVAHRLDVLGDTDGDDDVDDSDLGAAFSHYTGPIATGGLILRNDGDADGDGDVDDSDLGTAFANYTGPITPGTVPEPGALTLAAIGGIALLRRSGRRH